MGSDELVINLFRISLTEQKLQKEKIKTEIKANEAHYIVGSKIRDTIKDLNATLPENLPTPSKSLKQIEKDTNRRLKQ